MKLCNTWQWKYIAAATLSAKSFNIRPQLTQRNALHAVISMRKMPALAVWLLNCISLLSSLDERMKYGQHYLTPKNNNSFANTNQFLKDCFFFFPVSALFSLEEVRLCPSNQPIQLISFLLSLHFKSLLKMHKTIGKMATDSLIASFLLTASFSQSCMTS